MMARSSRCPVVFLYYLLASFISCITASFGSFLMSFSPGEIEVKSNGKQEVFIEVFPCRLAGAGRRTDTFRSVQEGNLLLQLGLLNRDKARLDPLHERSLATDWQLTSADKQIFDQHAGLFVHDTIAFNSTYNLKDCRQSNITSFNVSAVIHGQLLGHSTLVTMIWSSNRSGGEPVNWVPVTSQPELIKIRVLDGNAKLNHIFVGVLTILIIIANLLMGSQLNLSVLWAVIKQPFAPLLGLMCQVICMPLISFAIAWYVFVPEGQFALALGLFTTGCSPGGGASNFWTILLGGNVDLSITMTFLSTVIALGSMPFWMFTLGNHLLNLNNEIKIPYKNIGISLAVLILPIFLGMAVRYFREAWALWAKKFLRPFIILIIIFICTFGVYANLYMFQLMSLRVFVAGLSLPWIGFAIGQIAPFVFRQPRANTIAIAVETGIQNTGIAIMLLKGSFVAPDGDLASVVPVVVAILTPVPLLVVFTILTGLKCAKKKSDLRDKVEVIEKEEAEGKIDNRDSLFLDIPGDLKGELSVENGDSSCSLLSVKVAE